MSNIKYTRENLQPVVASSNTWREVCLKLGIAPMTGSQSHLKRRAAFLGVDSGHFYGPAWRATLPPHKKTSLEEYLRPGSRVNSDKLRRLLISSGTKAPRCERCGLEEWLGGRAPLELDHINSDHSDNRLENLQILCPNCHAVKTVESRRAPLAQLAEASRLGREGSGFEPQVEHQSFGV